MNEAVAHGRTDGLTEVASSPATHALHRGGGGGGGDVVHSLGLDLAKSPRWVTHTNPASQLEERIIESPSGKIRYRNITQAQDAGGRKEGRKK